MSRRVSRARWRARRRSAPWGGLGRVGEEPVDLACDVAFEAADDLAAGFAVGASALGVVDGALVDAQQGDGDAPQGVVGLAVVAAVEAVAHGGA